MNKLLALMLGVCLFAETSQAQMIDELGSLAVDGAISAGGYQAIGQGQRAYNRMQFQQDLSMLVAEIQTTYMGNYAEVDKSILSGNYFRGIEWTVGGENGGFYADFQNLDGATCFLCKGNAWGASRVEISGNNCSDSGNHVKMIF